MSALGVLPLDCPTLLAGSTEPLYTLYPVTPVSSVEAVQARLTLVPCSEPETTCTLVGWVGGLVSCLGVCTCSVPLGCDSLPAASRALM